MASPREGTLFAWPVEPTVESWMNPVFFLPEQEGLLSDASLEGLAEQVRLERWEKGVRGILLLFAGALPELDRLGNRLEGAGGVAPVWVLPAREPHLWAKAARLGGVAFAALDSGSPGVLAGIRAGRAFLAEWSFRILPFEEAWFALPGAGREEGGLEGGLGKVFHFPGNVGIQGEEGTGASLLAWALHCSRRPGGPFLSLECSFLREKETLNFLLGRSSGEKGILERLKGGTLVLRNPRHLPHAAQAALFAWLHRERERNGGERTMVQVISTGTQSLASLALEGEFNRALALTLEERSLVLPPLRERKKEIPSLAAAWCAAPERGCSLSFSAARALQGHHWPRNVLELEEVLDWGVDRAGPGGTILPMHLPPSFHGAEVGRDREELYLLPRLAPGGTLPKLKDFREQARLQAERVYLLKALESAGGKVSGARKIAGFSKSTFYALLQKHGLLPPRKKEKD